ncbi:MAG: hypothetical protein F6K18_16360 [Okeania sp. SIO2C2]|nr:hypothetical protein [Okeania sp. SIO2C2]NEP88275.1 hypothetical protein [Okeania sp. SIO2C2]
MLKRVYDINLNYLGDRRQSSGVRREEAKRFYLSRKEGLKARKDLYFP